MVQHLDEALHEFSVDVHGVFVEAVVEVVGQLFVLGLSVGRVRQVVLVERVFEYVLRLHDVDRSSAHLL